MWKILHGVTSNDVKGGGGGGGVQGQISRKHDFEITGDPKGPPSGSTFWWGFEAPDSYGYLWGRAPFRAKK